VKKTFLAYGISYRLQNPLKRFCTIRYIFRMDARIRITVMYNEERVKVIEKELKNMYNGCVLRMRM